MRSMVSGGLVAVSGLMLCAPLSAQVKPTFGLEGGLNFAKINIEQSGITLSFENRTGLAIGGFLQTSLGNTLILEPHVLYSQQGAKLSDNGASFTIKLDYLHVPVLVRYNIPMASGSMSPFLVAGPYLGIKIDCSAEYEDDTGSISADCDDADENFKSTDFGLSFGAGVGFQKLMLTLRYSLGLMSIAKDDPTIDPDPTAKNRLLSLLIGFRL